MDSGDLRKFGYRVRLQPKSFLVLRALLERPGELVTREELKAQLWAENTFVEFESSLNVAVRRLREALGDEAQHPAYIETVPRHGYRFVGVIERELPRAQDQSSEISPSSHRESVAISPVGIHILTSAPRTPPPAAQKVPSGILWKLIVASLAVVVVALIGVFFLKQSAARRLARVCHTFDRRVAIC